MRTPQQRPAIIPIIICATLSIADTITTHLIFFVFMIPNVREVSPTAIFLMKEFGSNWVFIQPLVDFIPIYLVYSLVKYAVRVLPRQYQRVLGLFRFIGIVLLLYVVIGNTLIIVAGISLPPIISLIPV